MKEKLELSNKADREKIIELLRKGKIGLFPTDTVWGICCRMDNSSSVEKVFTIKNREKSKPFLLLASSINQVEDYAFLDKIKKDFLKNYWPGPLTVILKAKNEKVSLLIRANGDTVGLRIPDFPHLQEILSDLGIPIIAPSANLSGDTTPTELGDVDEKIIEAVDFVVQGACKIKKPSTIIDYSEDNIKVVREGAISFNL